MSDESKVNTTFIRPVNRTMSYEDRRGYVCMYMYVCMTFPEEKNADWGAM